MTRKAPRAAVLTALLAVLALLFGAMTMAATATADPDPNKTPPGQSEEFVPPGQDEGFVPPGQVTPKPDEGTGDDGLVGGNPDVVCAGYMFKDDGLSGFTYTITARTEGGVTDWCLKAGQTREYGNGGYAKSVVVGASGKYEISHVAWNEGTPPVPVLTPAEATLCVAPLNTTTFSYQAFSTADNTTPQATWTNAAGQALSTFTVGTAADCTTTTTVVPPTTTVVPPTEEVTTTTAVEAATVEEADAVAPVEAATVTEQPEAVAVPAPAKVATPAAVPAGDGSSVPQVPVALLALLALATAAAVTSGLRMATIR